MESTNKPQSNKYTIVIIYLYFCGRHFKYKYELNQYLFMYSTSFRKLIFTLLLCYFVNKNRTRQKLWKLDGVIPETADRFIFGLNSVALRLLTARDYIIMFAKSRRIHILNSGEFTSTDESRRLYRIIVLIIKDTLTYCCRFIKRWPCEF